MTKLWQVTADIEINDGVVFEDTIHFALETADPKAAMKMLPGRMTRSIAERLLLPPDGVAVTIKAVQLHSEHKSGWLKSVWNRVWGRK